MKTALLIHQQKGTFVQDGGSVADVGSRELHVSDNANRAYQSHYPRKMGIVSRQSLQDVQKALSLSLIFSFRIPIFKG